MSIGRGPEPQSVINEMLTVGWRLVMMQMWTLRTVLARLQAQHRHCQANGTDTPQVPLFLLVHVHAYT